MSWFEILICILLSPFYVGAIFGLIVFICINVFAWCYGIILFVINPIYYIFTGGKNLKIYEHFRDMPHEDDFF